MERKEAIEIIKKNWPDSNFMVLREALETLIPELKESEDERIKKAILIYLDWLDGRKDYAPKGKYTIKDMILWLKKQGEQKPQGKSALEAINKENVDNANKVEPKFNEGEWISGYNANYKVLSVNNNGYLVEDVDENKINILFENEKFHHLFTITDAKDGDVLCCESGWTCIFKALNNNTNTFSSYCFMDNTGWFCETGSEAHTLKKAFIKAYNGNIYPATKEQRDIFSQKMKEAGYEWDAEKKELKKVEQKSAWSEEDKKMIDAALQAAHEYGLHGLWVWLKRLKERVLPQNTWKPSDEQIKAVKEAACYSSVFSEKTIDNLISLSKQLKTLREE